MPMTNSHSIVIAATLIGALALPGCMATADDVEGDDQSAPETENPETSEEAVSGCIPQGYYYTDRFCYLRSCASSSCAPLEGIGAGAKIQNAISPDAVYISCPSYGFYHMMKSSSKTWGWVHYSCF